MIFQKVYFALCEKLTLIFGTDLFSRGRAAQGAGMHRLDIIFKNINFDEIRETILFLFSVEVFEIILC